MKQLLYVHTLARPIVASVHAAIMTAVGRRFLSVGRRLIPGERGRRIVAGLLWALGLVLQVVLVWLLSELVTLCIDLMELWALLARKYVEINP
jgi:hypothetical protein